MPTLLDPVPGRKVVIDERTGEISDDSGSAKVASAPAFDVPRQETVKAIAMPPKMSINNPWEYRLSSGIDDPLYQALRFKWSDRQQHGRAVYDTMYKHAAVAAPFDSIIAFLKSYRPMFKPVGTDPTALQRQLADFANEQLRRLGSSGDSRQGYEKVIDWIGQGLKYGFTLAEMETGFAPWQGQRRIQIKRILPLPQASLDNNQTILEEYGEGILSPGNVRYRCFELDQRGRIVSAKQFWQGGGTEGEQYVEWTGAQLLRLLHFTHGATEGNPYGQSMFFTAFYHWASLYALEQMEEAFLDASLPYLTVSYKTVDGRPSPALHAQFLDTIKQQDPAIRALIMPDATFGSTAPSNPSFTEHAKLKKAEQRRYIHNSIMGIPVVNSDAGNELDSRNSISTFFTYILPGLQREIATLLESQFARRLIDTNWASLSDGDYPKLVFQSAQGGNDLRIALPLIQQIMPFVDSTRVGEMLETLVPGFDRDWIPASHGASMMEQRGSPDPASGSKGQPVKPEGTADTKLDDSTSTIGQDVG